MHVTATRSMPGGLAQVKWDDEGVEPRNFDLVKSGMLTDLQRNREGTGWMKGYLTKTGQALRSNGCAYASDAVDAQTVHPADLILHPDSARDTTLTQLREQIDKGIEFKEANTMMDFQQSTGMLGGTAFLIAKGKRVARIAGAGMLFRTPELWGNLQALGGPSSVHTVGTADSKTGNVWKQEYSSVNTPPALFKEMSIVNPFQKA
jgi:TldD protein